MGFFARLSNMISGFLNCLLARLKKSPAAVYELAIQERIKTYQGLKKQSPTLFFCATKLRTNSKP